MAISVSDASVTDASVSDIAENHAYGRRGREYTNEAKDDLVTALNTTKDLLVTQINTVKDSLVYEVNTGVPIMASLNITTTEMTEAATTQTFDIVTPSATQDAVVLDAWFKTTTLVSGGTIDSAVLEIGNDEATADPNAYVLQTDVFTGASTGYQGTLYTSKGTDLVTVNTADYGRNTAILSATQKIQAKLTTGTGDVADATAGDLTCYVVYMLLP